MRRVLKRDRPDISKRRWSFGSHCCSSSANYTNGFIDPVGKQVRNSLDGLESNIKHHIYKWRGGVLIVLYPGWFAKPVDAVVEKVSRYI